MTSIKPPNPPWRHHHVPKFLLQQWSNDQGEVAAYTRLDDGRIALDWKSPKSIGYVKHLYSFPELGEASTAVETSLLSKVDDRAAKIVQSMIETNGRELTITEMVWWSHFLLSLIIRNPESVAALKATALTLWSEPEPEVEARYQENRREGDPATYEAWLHDESAIGGPRLGQRLLHDLIMNSGVAEHIRQMNWQVYSVPEGYAPLLSSDRPLFSSNGIKKPSGQLILPIGPRHCFCAFNDDAYAAEVSAMPADELVDTTRKLITVRAKRHVYGSTEGEAGFLQKWLGYERVPSMGELLAARHPEAASDIAEPSTSPIR